jgi:hypothetical protein
MLIDLDGPISINSKKFPGRLVIGLRVSSVFRVREPNCGLFAEGQVPVKPLKVTTIADRRAFFEIPYAHKEEGAAQRFLAVTHENAVYFKTTMSYVLTLIQHRRSEWTLSYLPTLGGVATSITLEDYKPCKKTSKRPSASSKP